MMGYPLMLGVMRGPGRIDLHATYRIDNGASFAGVGVIAVIVGARVVMVGVHASSRDNSNGLTLSNLSIRVVSEGGRGAVVGDEFDDIGLDATIRQLHSW
jgi:hypothetical protein